MANSGRRERPAETVQVEARRAADPIRNALRTGGMCAVEVGSKRRTLMHDPTIDVPRRPWPWPLRLFQPHPVRYVVYEDVRRVSGHIFVRGQIDQAIGYFLRDVGPEAPVTVQLKGPG